MTNIYLDPPPGQIPLSMPFRYALLSKLFYKEDTYTRLQILALTLLFPCPKAIQTKVDKTIKRIFHVPFDEKDPIEITKNSPKEQEKWIKLAKIVETVKEKYGITDEISIRMGGSPSSIGFSIYGNVLSVNEKQAFKYSSTIHEFIIAHELAHYQQSDVKGCCLHIACTVINVTFAALAVISFPLFFCALIISEFVLFHFRQAWSRKVEKEADLMAINTLGSNKGALDFFNTYLVSVGSSFVQDGVDKPVDAAKYSRLLKIGEYFENITNEGPLKYLHCHPSCIERRRYCQDKEAHPFKRE